MAGGNKEKNHIKALCCDYQSEEEKTK